MRVVVSFEQDSVALLESERHCHIWVVESPPNRVAAEARWREEGMSKAAGMTVFDQQSILDLLPTVLEHHPDCGHLQVHGAKLTARARHDLRGSGFTSVQVTPGGFLAVKLAQAP